MSRRIMLIAAALLLAMASARAEEVVVVGEDQGIIEQAMEFWDTTVRGGLEKYVGYPVSMGEFRSTSIARSNADKACSSAERALGQGRDTEASLKLNQCRILAMKVRHGTGMVRAMALLGELHQAQGKQTQALVDYQTTVLVARQYRQTRYEARALLGISTLNLQYGDYQAAESAFLKLPAAYREARASEAKDLTPDMTAQVLYVKILIGLHKPGGKSLVSLFLAPLDETKDKLSKTGQLYYWHAKAMASLAADSFDDAAKAAESGLEVLKTVAAGSNDLSRGRLWRMALAGTKGLALQARGKNDAAVIALEEARDSYYVMRSEVWGDERIAKNLSLMARPYMEGLMEAHLSLAQTGEALKVAADTKNLAYGDEFRMSTIGADAAREKAIRSALRKMMERFVERGGVAKKMKTAELFPPVDAAAAGSAKVDENQVYLKSTAVLTTLFPAVSMDIDADDFSAKIPEGAAHLELYLGDSPRAFLVTRKGVVHAPLSARQGEVRALEEQLALLTTSPQLSAAAPLARAGRELYDLLMKPALAKATLTGVNRLSVGPHGPAYATPLALLHDGTQLLIDRMALAVSPNLYGAFGGDGGALDPNVAYYQISAPPGAAPADGRAPASAAAAPAAPAPNLAKMAVLARPGATKENVLAAFMGQKERNVLHLAATAEVNSDDPYATSFPGELKLRDFLGFRSSQLRLVALTGLQFGDVDGVTEPLVYGALLDGGAGSALVSRWDVADGASRNILLEKFYAETALGVNQSEALRKAVLAVRANPAYAHPHFWAGYALVGGWR